MNEEAFKLERPDGSGDLAFIPPAFGPEGRFRFREVIATAGQGYTLLVTDTWTGGLGVLKGLWWEPQVLAEPRRIGSPLAYKNGLIASGAEAVRRATQLTQQAPIVVTTLRDPSPTLQATGHGAEWEEQFVVQQFVGYAGSAASTLTHRIREIVRTGSRFSELELLDLASQLCDTLAAVHAKRKLPNGRSTHWVHADIKPDNILVLGPPWRYILIDYDGAVAEGDRIPLTTAEYAPPRRADGYGAEEERALAKFDLYMFGATLAEAAGLRRLDDAVRNDLYGDPDRHRQGKQAIRKLGYGPILTTVIASCLAEPTFRLGSAVAVATDLARARSATVLSERLLDNV